jgi:hypothetical protein
MEFRLSDHAERRAAQRNLSHDEINFLLEHGTLVHNTGVIFCRLRQKDVPSDLPANSRYRRLVGTTVILCRCGHYVVTLYREQRAFHSDTCKTEYSQRNGKLTNCPYCNLVA